MAPPAAPTFTQDAEEPGGSTYLGVPDTHTSPRGSWQTGGSWGQRRTYQYEPNAKPRYREEHVLQPTKWSPAQVAQHQAELEALGLLDEDDYQPGKWNAKSSNARRALLKDANIMGISATDLINEALNDPSLIGKGDSDGGSEDIPDAFVFEAPNPDDLKKVFDNTARTVIGRKLDDLTLQRMVESYTALERGTQQSAFDVGNAGGEGIPGQVTEGESTEGFAIDYLEEQFPEMVESQEMMGASKTFFDMIRQSGKG